MKWEEVGVRTSHEAMDIIASAMNDLGATGVVMDDPALINEYIHSGRWEYTDLKESSDTSCVTVSAYFPIDDKLDDKIKALRAEIDDMASRGVDTRPGDIILNVIDDEDWANSWKKYFHTEKVGERIVIQPSWESYDAKGNEIVIILDPGAAFGTGTHATTSMCLGMLEGLVSEGDTAVDIGTGSGVLAIAEAKLGASRVTAVDYDETALGVARDNIAKNGIGDKIEVMPSDLLKNVDKNIKAKVVSANLIADLIIRLFNEDNDDDGLSAHLADGGRLLASGIIESRADDVRQAAEAHGYEVVEQRAKKEWVAMVIKRK
ncbi:MAG: 50S ribosomal protein L11 methyltransferase [Schwartzia sp.]|nr:50S ribosomal protein L11 methyltransferase [Schwartzia sp. (in: firmicutes)]